METSGTPSRPAASGGAAAPGSAAPTDDAGVTAGAATGSASGSGGSGAQTVTAKPSSSASASTSAPAKPAAKPAVKPATKPAAEVASTGPVRVASGAAAGLASVAVTPAPARPAASDPMTPVAPRVPPSVTATPAPATRPSGPRRARLLVSRLDPWSVMKTAFMLSISVAIVLLMATALLWWTLSVTGVFSAIGRTVNDIAGTSTTSFDFLSLVSFSRVMGVALVLAAVEVVLMSALTTLFAFLYNLSVGLTGGLEVTLSEDA